MVTVLTAGHVNWDVTLRVDRLPAPDGESRIRSRHQSGGGSAANVAAALAALEVDTALVGSVGDDDHGLLARRELERTGVDLEGVRTVEGGETAVKYLLVDDGGEVAILGGNGDNEAIRPSQVDPDRVQSADHVHLTSQRPETAARIATLAREAGVTVSFDPGRRVADRQYDEVLAASDVIFANGNEVTALFDGEYVDSPYADRVVVEKRGSDGAVVHSPSGTCEHAGFDVDPVDTAGAGDAFAAGFIAVRIDGGGFERALEYANACGALAARRTGTQHVPSVDRVGAFLESRW
ncbi:carbohydrate kinase family protein [Natrarchaeobaculum aegyptiacum]|uniref:Sugar kinase n=1 Tax=Natrarchaeobaculum aegyptiacum TaxID=745377 RepID=A0A2Z2HN86_9EURY|nr:carbohydrate kinase family protein [Natrarchaeobaculum aegyptiacum]ARS88331.1 sugar kinase [Natrarchaeobaculum aegyptiacum]